MKKIVYLLATCMMTASCTTAENYLLGKDNTPKPTALEAIEPKVDLVKQKALPIGKKQNDKIYAKLKPVIQKGVIYTADASGDIKATRQSDHVALWSENLKSPILAGPTIGQDVLACSTADSALYLLNASNGKVLWKKQVTGQILSNPAIAQGIVVAKTIDGKLYAFNSSDGKKRWLVNHGTPEFILKASSSPVIHGNRVFAGFSDGKFIAVDLHTGHQLWQKSIAYPKGTSDVERLVDIDADPVIKGDTVYLATYQGHVGALSLDQAKMLWHKPASVYKNISYKNHMLYMTDADDTVLAVDADTGRIKWKQTGLKARGLTEPTVADGKVFIGDKLGYLHVLSADNGQFIGRSYLNAAIKMPPVVDQNKLYVQTANGVLNEYRIG